LLPPEPLLPPDSPPAGISGGAFPPPDEPPAAPAPGAPLPPPHHCAAAGTDQAATRANAVMALNMNFMRSPPKRDFSLPIVYRFGRPTL